MKEHMQRNITAATVVVLTTLSLAYGQDFDADLAKREIEVMKSIFTTSIDLTNREPRDSSVGLLWTVHRSGAIEGFYLMGQGTTFLIPASAVPEDPAPRFEELRKGLEALKRSEEEPAMKLLQLQNLERSLQRVARNRLEYMSGVGTLVGSVEGVPLGVSSGVRVGTHYVPLPWRAEAVAVPQVGVAASREVSQEDFDSRLKTFEAELVRVEAELTEKYRAAVADRDRFKDLIIDVISKHGDSLTHLDNDEYINLILVNREGSGWRLDNGRDKSGAEILSIRKGLVVDLKAGRLDLPAFKRQIQTYHY